MAVIAMATADLNDLSVWDASGGSPSISSAGGARTGTNTYRNSTVGGYFQKFIASASEIYGRLALNTSADYWVRLRNGSTTITQLTIGLQALAVYRGIQTGTLLTQVADTCQTWDCYEFYVKVHSSTGIWQVKKNGQLLLDASNLNTGTGTFDNIMFYTSANVVHYLDDILVDDANWPGLGGIEVLRPNGAGTHQDWDDSDYEKVNADNDSTYIASDAEVSERVSFTLPALAGDRKTPKAVGLFTKSRLSGAGAGTIEPYFDDTPGAQLALSTSLQYTKDYQVAMPTEVGLKVVV